MKRTLFFVMLGTIVAAGITFFIIQKSPQAQPPAAAKPALPPLPQAPRLRLTVGASTPVAQGVLNADGGVVQDKRATAPNEGLRLTAPAGAYATPVNLEISCAESSVAGDFPARLASPLITVEGAETPARKPLIVTVPVKLKPGEFAMGFYYDRASGELGAMPLISCKPTEVTVATRHFSSFLILSIVASELLGDCDSGYRRGVDDWGFKNWGSYPCPHGFCEGMSLSSIWYFVEKRHKGADPLNGLYDNDGGGRPKTPDVFHDDALAIRLVTAVQRDSSLLTDLASMLIDLALTYSPLPYDTYNAVALAIKVTGKPQMIGLLALPAKGHAIVAYRANGGVISLADPNDPEHDSFLKFDGKSFAPYTSDATTYTIFTHAGLEALVGWHQVAARWKELEAGTIGKDIFAAYTIYVVDEEGNRIPFGDRCQIKGRTARFEVQSIAGQMTCIAVGSTGKPLEKTNGQYTLPAGENAVGLAVDFKGWAGFERGMIVCADTPTRPQTITVTIRPDGSLMVDGQVVDAAALAGKLRGATAVKINGGLETRYAHVVPALTACASAGLGEVTLETEFDQRVQINLPTVDGIRGDPDELLIRSAGDGARVTCRGKVSESRDVGNAAAAVLPIPPEVRETIVVRPEGTIALLHVVSSCRACRWAGYRVVTLAPAPR